jgi:hypothetical protein
MYIITDLFLKIQIFSSKMSVINFRPAVLVIDDDERIITNINIPIVLPLSIVKPPIITNEHKFRVNPPLPVQTNTTIPIVLPLSIVKPPIITNEHKFRVNPPLPVQTNTTIPIVLPLSIVKPPIITNEHKFRVNPPLPVQTNTPISDHRIGRSIINVSTLSNYVEKDENFKIIVKGYSPHRTILGKSYKQPDWVLNHKLEGQYGIFADYLIRHYVYSKQCIVAMDMRAEEGTKYNRQIDPSLYQIMENSYNIFKSSMQTLTIVSHIYNTSLFHTSFFDRDIINASTNVNYKDLITQEMFTSMTTYIDAKMNGATNIVCNPTVGDRDIGIAGDADLIIDCELIDFKTGRGDTGSKIKDFCQLFIYTILYYCKTQKRINRLTIYNLILNCEYTLDISEWNKDKELIILMLTHAQARGNKI